ncbi:hypothetical protein [endosymbiont GvMRE of Glomus versiforme]|uniref:hypothetical protein n=1 Tax=endosymbiont GvMRE of Glomus versiforme TaxID=2039283 RepID=UPI000EEC9A20|nr:hypothetical protein [endosymbiont GvMRE of Glomus versiforme]RHZ35898.1 hypothetical protein GvMRE_Ic4g121 [endosymbiont GvMRE of Glomus versiforme]RHZ36574.1 hypothetical protein GvMRE_I2g237 [endosymbiont GvMRE of Glomus versiforme]RHZ36619.1 hypothetical protein GvMRE_I2g6 [endosymbiont GvMRE of Glomus versiforme]
MNKILIIAILLILIVYYFSQKQEHPKTIPKSLQPALKSTQTQTNLSDKQISLLTNQWNQVALWAQEQGIDTNKSWNLTMLKNKLESQLKPTQKPTNDKETQTDNLPSNQDQSALETTLNNLIASMQKLNQEIK